ncbi:transcriptional regulator, LysR family [Desulfovibrio sp. X2]|uniref:LysR family transcriptional regulator n=1 Tax=Desulfovibrio sp. X2 TaxID=941449 RepID=UPI000358F41E|nr:LysR family transcriptional regulator [Desulfovibrio sp. X2]EPR44555.1 transcriptional regulator, LysR family [Desulfovibrio sp. X2]
MLDIHLLKTFLAVAAGLSFRKAAAELNCAPSTVTGQIKALEEAAGAPLFVRSGRRVELTDHGRRLLGHARRIVDLEGEARRMLAGGDTTDLELSVRISESLGSRFLPGLLAGFRERFPRTRLSFATHSRHGLTRDLCYGITDLALILSEPFAASGVHMRMLCRLPLSVVVPPGSFPAGLSEVGPQDLAGVQLILTPKVWSARGTIEQALSEEGVEPLSVVECGSMEIVKGCVMAGQGVAVLPDFTVEREVAEGRLARLPWAHGPLSVPLLLARSAERPLTAAAKAFAEAATALFGEVEG